MKLIQYKILPILLLFFTIGVFGQTDEEKIIIKSNSNIQALNNLKINYQNDFELSKQRIQEYSLIYGYKKYNQYKDGSFDELVDITVDGIPIYNSIQNINAAISSRTNHLNIGGSLGLSLNGQNMEAYIWDGGPVRISHQEFNSRVSIGDGATTLNGNSYHSTHVTGTITAKGINTSAKGMANQSNVITNDWNNDLSEATTAAMNGALLSNHSYGRRSDNLPDWMFGAYSTISRDWDNVMFNAPYYLMIKSAGNDGNNNTYNALPLNGNSGYDKLGPRSTAKNNLVIASVNDAIINSNGELISATVASSSSQGPTDDLRIKPDIAGNGVSVFSTDSDSNNDYRSLSGTSMSSPNVTGSLLLLQQHYNNINSNFMKASTLKGLVLHTADDLGQTGPDAITGWGLLNSKKAAKAITDVNTNSFIEENSLISGGNYNKTVTSDGIAPLVVSISWTDPSGTVNTGTANLSTPVLVNDLDIRITQKGTTYYPYKLTSITTNTEGDNIVDPYEKIIIYNPSGDYDISISHKGNLVGGFQNYSLIITGIESCLDAIIIADDVNSGQIDEQSAKYNIYAINKIHTNSVANYDAGTQVSLKPGFRAYAGSNFKAFIEGCTSQPQPQSLADGSENIKYNVDKLTKKQLKTYPNPTNNILNIESEENMLSWSLTNQYGTVNLNAGVSNSNSKSAEIQMQSLPTGIYYLKVLFADGEYLVKTIIKE